MIYEIRQSREKPINSSRWKILAATSFSYLIYAVVIFNIPPIISILVDLLNISHTEAGILMSIAVFPAIFLSFPFGLLINKYGTRITGSIALVVIILGTAIVAMGNSFWVLLIGRLIVGIATALLIIALPKLITNWFTGQEIGLAMGIYHASFPLGNILVLNFAGMLAYNMGWQVPIWGCAALSVLALLLYIVLVRDRKENKYEVSASSNLFKSVRLAGWEIWCIAITWGLFSAGTIPFFTFAPDYFVSSGKTVLEAGLIASSPMFGSIILAPFIGLLIDRVGNKWFFIVVGLLGITLLLFSLYR